MADTLNSNVQKTRFTVLSVLVWLSASAVAQDGASLIGHWTLDNGANDAVGTYNGQLIGIGADNPALPAAVPGKIGQALEFDGATSVEIPIDLDYRTHSALTVTMWVRLGDKPRVGASQVLISTGAGDGPRIELARNQVRASAAGRILGPKHALLPGKWNFVAVSWDHAAGNMTMTVNNTRAFYPLGYEAKRSQQNYVSPRDPDLEKDGRKGAQKRYLWIGAKDGFGTRASLKDVAIDDVRIYEGVVAADQLVALSGGVSNGTYIPDAMRGWGGPWRSPISGDQFEPNQIPGDQFDQGESQQGSTLIHEPGQPAPSVLQGDGGSSTEFPEGRDLSSDTVGDLQQARDESAPPELPAGSASAASAESSESGQQSLETRTQALEETGPRPVGEAQFSGLSGFEGDNKTVIELENEFLDLIYWEERNNIPCFMTINEAVSFRDSTYQERQQEHIFGYCGPGVYAYPPNRTVLVPEGSAIGRIEVCSTFNSNERLKGIRVHSDVINSDGTTTYVPNASTAKMNNCSESGWHQSVLCPIDTVGTGLVVHHNYNSTTGSDVIVGLQLVCRRIGVE